MSDPFLDDMSKRLQAINAGAPAPKDPLASFMRSARKIKKKCDITSTRSCERGTCRYSTGDGPCSCIFKAAGLGHPFEWNLPRSKKTGHHET